MEISKGITICGKSLCLKKHDTLVFSDLQIGYEHDMHSKGFLVPKFQLDDIRKDLGSIIKNKKFDRIIINGDFKHEFSRISDQEWREAIKLIDYLSEHCNELILVRGNHDNMLFPIANKKNIKMVDEIVLGDVLVVHGDKKTDVGKDIKTIIIGHEHPALGLRRGTRSEKYKCFLKGKYKAKQLIVLPSFNPLVAGTDILGEKLMSPFIKKDISDFEVFVVEEEIFRFGAIKNIIARMKKS